MCSTPRMSFCGWKSPVSSGALADVLGEIADALEVVGDAQRAHDLAQIDRHRLAARDGEHRLVLDLALQGVDAGVALDHAPGALDVALGERRDRVGDLLLGKAAHLRDHAGEFLQVDVEGLGGVFVHHGGHPWRARRRRGRLSRSGR